MRRHPTLRQLGEFGLIDLLAGVLGQGGFERPHRSRAGARAAARGRAAGAVRLAIGDDAAVLRVPPSQELVFTTDVLLEGVHFRLDWATPEEVGRKALAVNVSDLAAMGARPLACVVGLGVRRTEDPARVAGIYRGLRRAAREYRLPVVGGDTVRSGALALSVAALGCVPRGRAVTRSGARPRDVLYVTGTLGDAALGLELFRRAARRRGGVRALRQSPDRHVRHLVRRFLLPQARLEAVQRLRALRPTAMIDVSDGLSAELGHLERSSGVRAHVDSESLPLSPALGAVCGRLGLDPIRLALAGGEDYELLFAIPPGPPRRGALRGLLPGVGLNAIGYLGPASRGAGRGRPGPGSAAGGFDHFR
ncbi:MAG TPA: thiamine-phosphate kinase [Candidatus Saccharimonadales bacterium]|nr:thiamine-phosphate kinase [Candidatus Saccharimonadales bacterium]